MLKNCWSASRPGDRLAALVAVLVAVLYTYIAVQAQTGIAAAQAAISWCFLPFFLVWRSRPVVSAIGFIACLGAWAAVWIAALPHNTGISPWLVAAPMAVYSTSRYCADRRIPQAVLAAAAAGTFASPTMWQLGQDLSLHYATGRQAVQVVAIHWLLLGLMYVAGARGFGNDLRRRAEESERLGRLRSAQEEERLLIARELHDVLAHSLTLMKVQASAGIVASKSEPAAAVDALETIRATSDDALEEVRGIVRALRHSGTSLEPARSVGDIRGILDGFRAAGLAISADLPERMPEMSALTELAVVRVITESLTNVLRHQGSDATVDLSLTCGDAVTLDIISEGAPQLTSTGGAGLVGLEERARSLGGEFTAGGTAERFHVHTTIPL